LPDHAKEPEQANGASEDFMTTLENGVKSVLKNKKASASERMAAVNAGVKLLAIRHKIDGNDVKGFFE
jgi:hypothetical protein